MQLVVDSLQARPAQDLLPDRSVTTSVQILGYGGQYLVWDAADLYQDEARGRIALRDCECCHRCRGNNEKERYERPPGGSNGARR